MNTETMTYREYSLCQRLGADRTFRRRFVHTLYLLWAFVGLGWVVGQMGPTFQDLRLIVDQDLDTASWLFTTTALGYMVGSLLGGIAYDRFNKLLLIAFSGATLGIFSGATPWCRWFPLMLSVRFIVGLGAGGLDTGGNADLIALWDDEGRSYMQALHFFFGVGGILSPLATEPFLAKFECVKEKYHNGSAVTMGNTTTNVTACKQVLGTSYVNFAYLITMVIVFSGTIPFFLIYVKGAGNQQHVTPADRSNLPYPAPLPVKQKALFLTLLFFIFFTYCAVEDTFSGYLATFCINYFKWDTSKSSFATSLHWASFSIGRFSGIFLVRHFKSVQLLIAYVILLVLSFVGFLACSLTYASGIFWLFVALPGFSMSVIYPCIFTWTEESILKVTGTVSSIFLIASSVGFTINPLLLGYLMDNKSPIWFVYILLGEAVLCFTTVLIVFCLSRTFVTVLVPGNVRPTSEGSIPGQVTHL